MKNRKPPSSIVLIVEHNELLLQLTIDIVEDAGFVVLHAANADEALAILESRTDVALLFTSIRMPGSMDGSELAHTVRKRWPAIKIVVASGQVRLMGYNLPADSGLLFKPYPAQTIIAELRSQIGR